jgi:hypothetical protein
VAGGQRGGLDVHICQLRGGHGEVGVA